MKWEQFEVEARELPMIARNLLQSPGMALIGTIRRDGSVRISSSEVTIVDGCLYVGMMWTSHKARDLLRDPRILVRSAICSNRGDERELSLRGRALPVDEETTRRRFVTAARTPWRDRFHLFEVDIHEVALVEYGRGKQRVRVWPAGKDFVRTYG